MNRRKGTGLRIITLVKILWSLTHSRARDSGIDRASELDRAHSRNDLVFRNQFARACSGTNGDSSFPCSRRFQVAFPKWPRSALPWPDFIHRAAFSALIVDAIAVNPFSNASSPGRLEGVHGSHFLQGEIQVAGQCVDFLIVHPDKTGFARAAVPALRACEPEALRKPTIGHGTPPSDPLGRLADTIDQPIKPSL